MKSVVTFGHARIAFIETLSTWTAGPVLWQCIQAGVVLLFARPNAQLRYILIGKALTIQLKAAAAGRQAARTGNPFSGKSPDWQSGKSRDFNSKKILLRSSSNLEGCVFLRELRTGRSFCWEVERGSRDSPSPDVTTAKHHAGPMEKRGRCLELVRRGRGVVLMVNNRADMTAPRRTARAEAGYQPLMIPTQPTPITWGKSDSIDGELDGH